jgi:hypothetical protein
VIDASYTGRYLRPLVQARQRKKVG